ncbi:MAG TPA: cob(I)yrinic acid a,c-diamide adenosyltransferase [Deltaproteobacteria bacterium]|nr:cob(I)yrinic acid a,c-diamide adenosyltransferase [Deltaproteobacteria bacterium]
MKGYVQVYTGDGKGKTTAAFGLALRAAGAGLKVYIAQFAKGGEYSEIKALRRFHESITVKQYGRGVFINGKPAEEDIRAARVGLKEARDLMVSGAFNVIILDEANIATRYNLFSVGDLLDFIETKPYDVELVITGRYADMLVVERADLVTAMTEVKHYFRNGVRARKGIEK